jgi:formylglycine-generating enzyme required for sulfatase activity
LKRLLLWCLRKGPGAIDLPPGMLPVFLPLRELKQLDQGFDAFIQDQLHSPHLKTPEGFGERLLRRGNLLFLLDGLDEVADLAQREQVAEWIVQGLRLHPSCRFVVTSRFAGYSPTVRLSQDFLEMHIRPLSEEQVERFVHNWYAMVEKGLAKDPHQAQGIAQEKAESPLQRLREPDFRARRVFELTRNPLLLANICLVHRHRGGLPQKRARLYEECIDVLLEHWREAKGLLVGVSAQDGRRALQPAALWLHSEEGRTRATAAELAPRVEPVLKAMQWAGGTAEDFLRTIRDESGLLTGWDVEHYGFMHLGFQEYLAAREICTRAFTDPDVLRQLAARFGDSSWQELGLLLLALEDPSLFTPYMREVVKQPSFATSADLVEACLDDAAETSVEAFVELLRAPAGSDSILWARQLQALRVLERLDAEAVGDLASELAQHPSPEIRRWIGEQAAQAAQDVVISEPGGYELVKIPGGVFSMGSPESEEGRWDDEGPVHEVQVPDFYMGRYPVTNEEYGRFLTENPDVQEPEYWADRQFNQPRQPVVGVSWEDARRYAEWAGLRLPSEAEWEYACRAETRTRYYTGDTEEDLGRAGWYRENSDEKLHPVGEKEPNVFGLYDMHGNVWEWVEDDWHDNYATAPNDGRAWIDAPRGAVRVLRGGSWSYVAQSCRSALRNGNSPDGRGNSLGFRLARSVALGP